MDLREVGCVPGDLIALAEDREQWCAYVRAELLLIIVTILFLSHFYLRATRGTKQVHWNRKKIDFKGHWD